MAGSLLLITEFMQVYTCDSVDCRSESFRYQEMAKLVIYYKNDGGGLQLHRD